MPKSTRRIRCIAWALGAASTIAAIGLIVDIVALVRSGGIVEVVDIVAFLGFIAVAAGVIPLAADAGLINVKLPKPLTATRDASSKIKQRSLESRTIRGAGQLIPVDVRDEYCEEWAAWISDLRIDGTPRIRLWIELLTIVLIAAPRLAIALRVAARRAVDR